MKTATTIGILALLLIWTLPAAVAAPQNRDGLQNADQVKQRLEEIKQRLNLTPEQIEEMRPVLQEEMQKLRSVRDKYSGSDQNRRTRLKMARELRSIQDDTDEKLKKILSKQQMEEMKKIREESREQLRERAGQK